MNCVMHGLMRSLMNGLMNDLMNGLMNGLMDHNDVGHHLRRCGGPPGWARLFVALWRATSDQRFVDLLAASVRATARLVPPSLSMLYPLPPGGTPWDNLGQCCGASAAGTFLLRAAASAVPLPDDVRREAR